MLSYLENDNINLNSRIICLFVSDTSDGAPLRTVIDSLTSLVLSPSYHDRLATQQFADTGVHEYLQQDGQCTYSI